MHPKQAPEMISGSLEKQNFSGGACASHNIYNMYILVEWSCFLSGGGGGRGGGGGGGGGGGMVVNHTIGGGGIYDGPGTVNDGP